VRRLCTARRSASAQDSSVRKCRPANRCTKENAPSFEASEAPISTWRALISRVENARAAIGTGQVHSSTAANCAPPEKTSSDMRPASAIDRPLPTHNAPNNRPIGMDATSTGAISRRPS
jgi:hypothetical protein